MSEQAFPPEWTRADYAAEIARLKKLRRTRWKRLLAPMKVLAEIEESLLALRARQKQFPKPRKVPKDIPF